MRTFTALEYITSQEGISIPAGVVLDLNKHGDLVNTITGQTYGLTGFFELALLLKCELLREIDGDKIGAQPSVNKVKVSLSGRYLEMPSIGTEYHFVNDGGKVRGSTVDGQFGDSVDQFRLKSGNMFITNDHAELSLSEE